jgi:glucose-6-phosphate-specific signal transduction histidine kinase
MLIEIFTVISYNEILDLFFGASDIVLIILTIALGIAIIRDTKFQGKLTKEYKKKQDDEEKLRKQKAEEVSLYMRF